MSPARAAATCPTPLSFARQAVRAFIKARARLHRLKLTMDAEGQGEALYRFDYAGMSFHYFVLSFNHPAGEKTDHNTGEKWDVMSALCMGDWTSEREANLRREIIKQRNGRPDSDTLVYARGNRSGRLFDHVVESLADGRQPDGDRLAVVGYIVRTTSFVGNGLLGMRAFAGYGADHPLRWPYHAQMCAAFLLREFVGDLVDAMAAARSAGAAKLDIAFRHALGLGNAAGAGLVSFTAAHPRLLHRWNAAIEDALAEARQRPVDAGRQRALIERAITYYGEAHPDRNGAFPDPAVIVQELSALRNGEAPALSQATREVLDAILLEQHPDIVARYEDAFTAEESLTVDPAMTVAELAALLDRDYGWALALPEPPHRLIWYRSEDAPGDSRRGRAGIVPDAEFESAQDLVPRVKELRSALRGADDAMRIGAFLLDRPALRYVTARVQSLAGEPYGEYRADYTDPAFSRFPAPRLILSFYGMEKLDTALPRSIRGVLMQGAPTAADVAAGRDGPWPFAPMPFRTGATPRQATRAIATAGDLPSVAVRPPGRRRRFVDSSPIMSATIQVSPVEMLRATQKALQGAGFSFGLSWEAAELVIQAEALHGTGLRSCLDQLAVMPCLRRAPPSWDGATTLDARGLPALTLASPVCDLACSAPGHPVRVRNTFGMSALETLPLRAASRGLHGLLLWQANPGFEEPMGEPAQRAVLADGAGLAVGGAAAMPFDIGPAEFLFVCLERNALPDISGWQRHAPPELGPPMTVQRAHFDSLMLLSEKVRLPVAIEALVSAGP